MNKKLKYSLIIIPAFIIALIILSRYANTLSVTQYGGIFSINGNTAGTQTVTNPTVTVYCSTSGTDLSAGGTASVYLEIRKIDRVWPNTLEYITGRHWIGASGGSVSTQITLTYMGISDVYCLLGRVFSNGYDNTITYDRITVTYQYLAHSLSQCYSGDIYWYDNKGVINDLKESCNDNNACTTDSCSGNTCSHTTNAIINSYCSGSTFYNNGRCNTQTGNTDYLTQVQCMSYCNGLQLNTYSYCDGTNGCVYSKSSCDDGNVCTTDSCSIITTFSGNTALCINTPLSKCCGDNICSTDETYTSCPQDCSNKCSGKNLDSYCSGLTYYSNLQCNPDTGIITSTSTSCNDNNACTNDICSINGCSHIEQLIDCSSKCTSGIVYSQGICDVNTGACKYDSIITCTNGCSSDGLSCSTIAIKPSTTQIPLNIILIAIFIIVGVIILIVITRKL